MSTPLRRFSSGAVLLTLAAGAGAATFGARESALNGVNSIPILANGRTMYVQDGSKRVLYPSREACLKDVPAQYQDECQPQPSSVSTYGARGGGASSRWYGPVYHPGQSMGYTPSALYPSEPVTPNANVGSVTPKATTSGSSHSAFSSKMSAGGFGSTGAGSGHAVGS